MKKVSFLLPTLAAITLLGSSCERNEPQPQQPALQADTVAKDVTVVDGRLVFADRQAVSRVLAKLYNHPVAEMQAWERQQKGFTSLRAATKDLTALQQENSLINQAYFSLFNDQGIVQMGNEIIMLHQNAMIVLPAGEAALLTRVKDAVAAHTQVDDARVSVHPIKEVVRSRRETSPTPEQLRQIAQQHSGSGQTAELASYGDAKYQMQFTANGVSFKHVHEVIGRPNYMICEILVRVKFEYKKKSGWAQAGESIEKRISNLNITGNALSPLGMNQISLVNASAYSFDNQPLEYYFPVPANEVWAQVSASMYSTAFGYTYNNFAAYWGDVYINTY
ncbi:hypothetical protein EJV47_22200 [Hymenobacter gummosus]|uniref:Uncharacterized protein n=1 Tax=Hymenobacter gummosus TaxID=1776032 RepID=A0A3S0JDY6_9BACT|nr:hypothetical protein [Hymenobacter gummosus]RTQ46244.1 hypothetical protein EJV47_22200 [Hymenobacter gummosus]